MGTTQLHEHPRRSAPQDKARLPLARALIDYGLVTPWQLFFALRCQSSWNATLTEILAAQGWVTDSDLNAFKAHSNNLRQVDLARTPPSKDTADLLTPEFCLKHSVLPWAKLGTTAILVTGRADHLDDLRAALPNDQKDVLFALADECQLQDHLTLHHRRFLTNAAETSVADRDSCRGFTKQAALQKCLLVGLAFLLFFAACPIPNMGLHLLTWWTVVTLIAATSLRVAALFRHLWPTSRAPPVPPLRWTPAAPFTLPAHLTRNGRRARLPRISMMVPLLHETEIASALIRRLTRLSYPRALLDVVLVLEENDNLTQDTIARTRLPRWMRVVEVPAGSGLTTKPRALNYALPFCRGEIIGIWDAEDAPAPDQLEHVAYHFAHATPDVACLQGVLDYYNPYTNWLSRCFAIEYAAWFRLVLPTLTRLGFPVPLGGTTLFLRREVIEEVGGWDSHNVTEDADLGMRLARRGYRTELINTITQEEANCRPIAWVRQRSRWLKGYMATYLVHMRSPRQLLRELGPRQFLGFQVLFLCTISQFLLAPFLWLLWGAAFGLPHPMTDILSHNAMLVLVTTLLLSGTTNGALWIAAAHISNRPRLYPWVLSMWLYFPLATLAAYKGLVEMLVAPFYWDKTSHGKTVEAIDHDLSAPTKSKQADS
ncbi:glycosyltransferase family 2 protein [Shimia sagamensis]|uniref:Glycosyltransferase, catalytic subunit of cellulose synthase and poly-beta-1,6-N-acetylglucosamine synthase n=1 Tax=Shimia sagamensis TaxID=1566352 RepID=A0ABY1NX58_9RHOB|nr:glycosyltransferase family 2 protein [Shimia sagamensis]SMP19870.1 Glycosyltransferase, catalytic subunit of cellulose synthase and poly-beta-1,6-N-acetylglucosamine synthase [Shimia sagamensis]